MSQHRRKANKRDSRRRVIRTAYATTVAFLTALPVMTGYLPVDYVTDSTQATAAAFGAWVVTVNKVIATLEDFGVIPAWLRDTNITEENHP